MANELNVGKTMTAVSDACLTAGINLEASVSVIYGVESAAIIQSHPDDVEDGDNSTNLMNAFRLLARELDTETLTQFKEQLEQALGRTDGDAMNDFIDAAAMMGMTDKELAADLETIKNSTHIPTMDEMWDKEETHDWSK